MGAVRAGLVSLITVACATAAPPAVQSPLAVATTAGAATIDVGGNANGLWWNAATRTLYVADDTGSRIVPWHDGSGEGAAIAVPLEGRPGLGQVVQLADGTLVVPRFGHRERGALFAIGPSAPSGPGGAARAIDGIDSRHRRLGVAPAPDGGVFVARFDNGEGNVGKVGQLVEVSLAGGGERELVNGLQKPVGLAVSGEWLYVSDQDANKILRCKAASCTLLEPVAPMTDPDLLSAAPRGGVFVGSRGGGITVVCPDGDKADVVAKSGPTHGSALDAAGHRLFLAEYDPVKNRTLVRAVPVDDNRICPPRAR